MAAVLQLSAACGDSDNPAADPDRVVAGHGGGAGTGGSGGAGTAGTGGFGGGLIDDGLGQGPFPPPLCPADSGEVATLELVTGELSNDTVTDLRWVASAGELLEHAAPFPIPRGVGGWYVHHGWYIDDAFNAEAFSDRVEQAPLVSVSDLDGDGRDEVVGLRYPPGGGQQVYTVWTRGDTGELEQRTDLESDGWWTAAIALADVDRNGARDVLIFDGPSSTSLTVYAHDGNFGFTRRTLNAPIPNADVDIAQAVWLDAFDTTGDGLTDVVGAWHVMETAPIEGSDERNITGDETTYAVVFPGNAQGGLGNPIVSHLGTALNTGSKVRHGDFTEDGIDDLVGLRWVELTSGINPAATTEVRIAIGRGDGSFEPSVVAHSTDRALWPILEVADLDGEPPADLLLLEGHGNPLVLLSRDAGARFEERHYGLDGEGARALALVPHAPGDPLRVLLGLQSPCHAPCEQPGCMFDAVAANWDAGVDGASDAGAL